MKKLTAVLLIIMLVFSIVPSYAASHVQADAQKNINYERQITVTEDGGVFQVGFVTIKFPQNFIDEDQLPVSINVKISAVDGVPYIQFTPDIPQFNSNVLINVHSYNGLLYDEAQGQNIVVHIKHQILNVVHFSRYAFS